MEGGVAGKRATRVRSFTRGVHHLALCTDDMKITTEFFEIPKGKEPKANRNAIGAMQHCAFVVTPARFKEIEARLKAHKIPYNGPIPQLPGLLGIYFYDPNGFRLEFACQPEDGEAPAVIPCVTQTKAEAARELATLSGADVAWAKEMTEALPD